FLDACPTVRFVANHAVGTDNIDLAAAAARGVLVTNTPGVLDEAVADHCVGLVLAAARRIAEGDRLVREGGWTGFSTDLLLGLDLAGATAGLVGVGGVGRAVATRLVAGFGMRGRYVARRRHPELEERLGIRPASLEELLAEADVVTLHVPLTPETRGMIGAAELARMRPGAVLVNVSRGPVVDQAALVEALRDGRIRAGLDVFEEEPLPSGDPLTTLDDVVLTPHNASAGRETRRRMAELAVDNLLAMAAGEAPPSLVA
ncbi:MAG TPA: NAD(P)-dependent oxidoreductase, partial [Miltoncostaea sp.]|nr:NAD(P)-dependent oxidoreductase [Miltoncostaea sp.]